PVCVPDVPLEVPERLDPLASADDRVLSGPRRDALVQPEVHAECDQITLDEAAQRERLLRRGHADGRAERPAQVPLIVDGEPDRRPALIPPMARKIHLGTRGRIGWRESSPGSRCSFTPPPPARLRDENGGPPRASRGVGSRPRSCAPRRNALPR